jgi:prepilin-type N-terminal cleavage/methylation domain-containing protein
MERFPVVRITTRNDGFSLIEVMIAMIIMTVGLMSLVGVAAVGVQRVGQSSPMLIAREKAREAIESVHSARDTGELAWAKVQNVAAGGIFLSGPQSLKLSGVDGLINTADDGAIETIRTAGIDNVLGNGDDVITTLTDYTREISITPLNYDTTGTLNPNLRQIEVIVRYRVDAVWRSYTITTYISSYS